MHFVDEGEGVPIVFVHGNPGWSFEFRNSIKELSKTYRCKELVFQWRDDTLRYLAATCRSKSEWLH